MLVKSLKSCLLTSLLAGLLSSTALAGLNTTQIGSGALGSIADHGGSSFTVIGGGNDLWDTGDEFTGAPVTSTAATLTVFVDVTPPTLVSAKADATLLQITLTFSEAVEPGTASDPANYDIEEGGKVINILSATVLSPTMVLLVVYPLAESTTYTITVTDIKDLAGNFIAPNPSTITARTPTFSPTFIIIT